MNHFNKAIEIDLDAYADLRPLEFYETDRIVLPLKTNCKFLLRVYPKGSLEEDTLDIGCFLTNNDGPIVVSRVSTDIGGRTYVAEKVHKVSPVQSFITIPHSIVEAQKNRNLTIEVNFADAEDLAEPVPAQEVEANENAAPSPSPSRRRSTPRRVLKADRKVKPQVEQVIVDLQKDALTTTAAGNYVDSAIQEIAGYIGCTWVLRVWPNGIDIKSERHVSVAAVINDAPGFVGSITFEAIGEGENLEVTVNEPIDGEYETTVEKFLPHSQAEKFVFDDQITIKCKIAFKPLP
uniref:Major sperm protein n=1 Tax=Panagrellus redivivus TaxID=6233 RepID=A0A7E4VAV7_PANRE